MKFKTAKVSVIKILKSKQKSTKFDIKLRNKNIDYYRRL